MKDKCKQHVVKLTTNTIGTHVMVQDVTKYGKQCLHQVVTVFSLCVFSVVSLRILMSHFKGHVPGKKPSFAQCYG